ncbi:histidine kinase,Response regulator receiver domain protein,histidine kinase [Rivularia sp. PCC 7116]|uniref:hybrid sensor histidine kinase/response regulator n=1 Tax=Rivularia sp. PCC 7116 TaxID=373994 RepID=UPI00029F359D|nr:response regulator [Rivularia sp. PCC 7116]AFY57161.1 histidine kinase,Response regulator receiver domain protein,histidine kinase [Rivularia sp. PCC 7116]
MNYLEQAIILIVDDNPTNLKVLSGAIADSGWEILVATDGESAVEQAEYAKPDLILLDVMMPGIDGFETCNRLKQNPATHEIPIIFMTALADTVDKVKGLSLGAVDYITKPFQTEEVLARVNVHLKIHFLNEQLAQQKNNLEIRVEQRTEELKTALSELQESQLQLVQTEKMSALGELVAGVAHEINNPVSFIDGNLEFLEENTSDIIKHLRLYQNHYPNPHSEILKDAEDIELGILIEDIPQIISSMKIGVERIGNISNSLRSFSRTDCSLKVACDIHEGIDSTLMILKHRLKASNKRPEIKVVKDYAELPLVYCYSGQLNQVFMNIISNSIDALDEYNSHFSYEEKKKNPHQILIKTKFDLDSDIVTIYFKDNGPGIPEDIFKSIFEQFFTTKSVGKGTGLGLSISRQIIEEKHQGKLSCNSSPGEGTEFTIKLPVE